MRGEDSNPEWFEQWNTIVADVSAQLYTDDDGNTTFTHLTLRVRIKALENYVAEGIMSGYTLNELYQKWMYKCEGKNIQIRTGKKQMYTTKDYAFFNNSKNMNIVYDIFGLETKKIKHMSDEELVNLYIKLKNKNDKNDYFKTVKNAVFSGRKLSNHPKIKAIQEKLPNQFYHYIISKDGNVAVKQGDIQVNAAQYEAKLFGAPNKTINRVLRKNSNKVAGFNVVSKKHIFIPVSNKKFKSDKEIKL